MGEEVLAVTAPVSAHDVAREIRRRLGTGIGAKKLQKLLYYCQAWHLTWTGEPLFDERIVAWDMGPVVAQHWADEKYQPGARRTPRELGGDQSSIIDYVLERYGHLNGDQLEQMTHDEAPWRDAGRNAAISHKAMRSFFENDEQFLARKAKAARIRARKDVYTLGPRRLDSAAQAAIDRALRGEIIHDR